MTATSTTRLNHEAAIYLALDALNFKPGDWNENSISRHLQDQIELARTHLQKAADGKNIVAEIEAQALEHAADTMDNANCTTTSPNGLRTLAAAKRGKIECTA